MSALAKLAVVGLVRAPGRAATRLVTLALAVALLARDAPLHRPLARDDDRERRPQRAARLAGPVGSYAAARKVAGGVARQPGVLAATPVATAPFAGIEHTAVAGTIRSGAGSILAVPPGYLAHFHTFRFLRGTPAAGRDRARPAARRHAAGAAGRPGHAGPCARGAPRAASRQRRRASSRRRTVLFQPLNPLVGPAPAQPPANIAILPLETFARRSRRPAIDHEASPGASAVPGAQSGIQWQVQAQVDPAALHGSPSAALTQATQIRNRVERSLPGQVVFVDNLADTLTGAAGDALYAETLYIMLAVPGALVALGLAYLAALGTVERDRRELALLRARGARRRDLLVLAGIESLLLGLLAGALGTAIALLAVHLVGSAGGVGTGRALVTFGICVGLAAAGAAAARIGAGLNAFRASVSENRRSARRERPAALAAALSRRALPRGGGLVYWLTARTGFSAVVNPDSNPTLSLSVYMFFAPALLWLGAALLLVRLRGRARLARAPRRR